MNIFKILLSKIDKKQIDTTKKQCQLEDEVLKSQNRLDVSTERLKKTIEQNNFSILIHKTMKNKEGS